MTDTEIKKLLCKEFPTARPGFIDVMVEAIALHAIKNHDYNGAKESKFDLGKKGKFFDINRKYSRLYHMLWEDKAPKVDEKLEETAMDLGNYAFLLVEELRK